MNMTDDLTTEIIDINMKITETHRDVRWICRTLKEMQETDADFENRIRDIEGWQAEKTGAEKRSGGIVAGVSGIVGALMALVVQWLGMG